MLVDAEPVMFLATADAARARAFYTDVLGLWLVEENDFALVLDLPGAQLRIQKVRALTPQPHTVAGWSVRAMVETVAGLKGRGVTFERYPFLEQDAAGIWLSPSGAKVAWFKDPDGNLLSLTQD